MMRASGSDYLKEHFRKEFSQRGEMGPWGIGCYRWDRELFPNGRI